MSNFNRLLFSRSFIFRMNMQYSVCIDIECYLNLRSSSWCGRNSVEMESAECSVIRSHWSLTLKNMNFYRGLAVRSSRECLALLCRYSSIRINHFCENTAECFDTE